jgi:serine/threonine protein kinase
MVLEIGAHLGPYEILAPIGVGGMGEVYRARDSRLDRIVAVKVIRHESADDPLLRERLVREARAAATLTHPHVCTLHDVGRESDVDYLVMEYVQGETLASRLGRGALPLDEALRLAIQLADALDAAHRQGVVHRDLKPGNIMLTGAGAKLLDFGLATSRDAVLFAARGSSTAPTALRLTAQGTILGTLNYIAPEQLQGHETDARADI